MLFRHLPTEGRFAVRDRALLLHCSTTPVPESKKSPISASNTWTLARSLGSGCMAKAISGASVRCGNKPPRSSNGSSMTGEIGHHRRDPYLSPTRGEPSPGLASIRSFAVTPRACAHRRPAQRAATSARIYFATRLPFICSSQVWMSMSFEVGSGTSASAPRTATPRSRCAPRRPRFVCASHPPVLHPGVRLRGAMTRRS
jgi:hypothetical protein